MDENGTTATILGSSEVARGVSQRWVAGDLEPRFCSFAGCQNPFRNEGAEQRGPECLDLLRPDSGFSGQGRKLLVRQPLSLNPTTLSLERQACAGIPAKPVGLPPSTGR